MSLVIRGFGSSLITSGFSGTTSIFAFYYSRAGAGLKTHPLIVQVKHQLLEKIDYSEYVTLIDSGATEVQELESKLAYLSGLLELVENTNPLIVQLNYILDQKITEEEFDTKLANYEVSLDNLDSSLLRLKSSLRDLEQTVKIHLGKSI